MKYTTNVRKLVRETHTRLTHKETQISVKELSKLLANTYLLYLKTQNYHWNVENFSFAMLHEFLDKQYKELADAVDEVAERIRMLDRYTPASFKEFLKLTTLHEEGEGHKPALEMLK